MIKVIFLDFDGVIRVQPEDQAVVTMDSFDFCPIRISILESICKAYDAKIVISSDWRHFGDMEEHIPRLVPYLYNDEFKTPCIGHRHEEVQRWLDTNEECQYAILEDWDVHFEGASEFMHSRIVWCDHIKGLRTPEFEQLESLLR